MQGIFRSLTFLGTSSGTPTAFRNVSSYCLTWADGSVWLFDAGEGTQHQLIKCENVSRGRIERLFVTHLHGDHTFGLFGLMCSISLTWSPPGIDPAAAALRKGGRVPHPAAAATSEDVEDEEEEFDAPHVYDHFSAKSKYLEICGPRGLAGLLRAVLLSSEARFGFQYRVTELLPPSEAAPGGGVLSRLAHGLDAVRHPDEVEPIALTPDETGVYNVAVRDAAMSSSSSSVVVRAAPLNHRVFTVGYVVTESDSAGTLNVEKATSMGVPKGPLLAKLKAGQQVTIPGSTVVVRAEDVVGPKVTGRTAVLLGDTCDSIGIIKLVQRHGIPSVDWVVHESTFDGHNEALAIPRGHSTAEMAGKFAADISAKHLVLTHFSARFPSSTKDPETMERLRMEAAAVAGPSCTVHVADDFSVFNLEPKRREK